MKRIELKVGERVRVSDGQPEPPKRHTRKHWSWECRNFEGYLVGFDSGRAGIDKDGRGIMVSWVPVEQVEGPAA